MSDPLDPIANLTGAPGSEPAGGFNVSGLASLAIFYLIVLAIGVWAGWRQRRIMKVKISLQHHPSPVKGLFVGTV